MKLSNKNIEKLINEHKGALRASIYIPTDPKKSTQDSTRLKNALQSIRNMDSFDERELGDSMNKIQKELVENKVFWNYQDFGLAVFFDHDGYEYFHMPFEISEEEYLTDHFVVSPLILSTSADTGFYLLDVNFNSPRLFVGARDIFEELSVELMPKSFEEVIGRSAYKNHNLGFEDNAESEDEKRYLRLLAEAVESAIVYDNRALLLAGTSNRTGNIRSLLDHGHLLNETLVGSYEKATTEEIYNASVDVIRQSLRKERDSVVELLGSKPPELVVIGTKEIKEAAETGRVERLLLPTYRLTNDSVRDSEGEKIVLELPSDIEDIEGAVRAVLMQSGEIVALEIDSYKELSEPKAICRF
jgi:hypothetical protein